MAIDLITLGVLTAFAAIPMRTERVLRRAEGAALLARYVVFAVPRPIRFAIPVAIQ
ncbi:hypothetical protein [Sorangium sp. So ce1335]|uniref:hypothetical protein n=1 Tax=Sorangium sp. So ce1335 TaxID=3133335 RepID=UPI003F6402DD